MRSDNLLNWEQIQRSRISGTVFIIACVFALIMLGLGLVALARPDWDLNVPSNFMLSFFSSVVAGAVFYYLYAGNVEKQLQDRICFDTAQIAANAVLKETETRTASFLKDRFEDILPEKVFSGEQKPQLGFREEYEKLLIKTKKFLFNGMTGTYTSYRFSLLPQYIRGKDVCLVLAHPADDWNLVDRAQDSIECAKDGSNTVVDYQISERTLRERRVLTFVTLLTLFELRQVPSMLEIAWRNEPPSFRSEIFDEGAFLTYYRLNNGKPTYYFRRGTLNYETCEWDCAKLPRRCRTLTDPEPNCYIQLHQGIAELEFMEMLGALECDKHFHPILSDANPVDFFKKMVKLSTWNHHFKEVVPDSECDKYFQELVTSLKRKDYMKGIRMLKKVKFGQYKFDDQAYYGKSMFAV